MRFFSPFLLVLLPTALSAQDPADIFHKTVDLDSINRVTLSVYDTDTYAVKPWPGDDILIETSVVLNNGQQHILDFFRKKKRWDLEPRVTGDQLELASGDTVRRIVQGTEGVTSETVNIVIYVPESFTGSGNSYTRR